VTARKSPSIIPAGSWPRGLNRAEAAAYIGVSPSKFDEMVKDERMPRARKIDARKVWDVRELDSFFNDLPVDNDAPLNSWDDFVTEGADDSP
jgi:predicted DNA-binding transcriptional regulator AlpA